MASATSIAPPGKKAKTLAVCKPRPSEPTFPPPPAAPSRCDWLWQISASTASASTGEVLVESSDWSAGQWHSGVWSSAGESKKSVTEDGEWHRGDGDWSAGQWHSGDWSTAGDWKEFKESVTEDGELSTGQWHRDWPVVPVVRSEDGKVLIQAWSTGATGGDWQWRGDGDWSTGDTGGDSSGDWSTGKW